MSLADLSDLQPGREGDDRGLRLRRIGWFLLVGSALVAFAAVAIAAISGASERVPVDGLVALAGNDYFLLGSFGTLALVVLAVMVVRRAAGQVEQAAPPDPETVRDAHRPGDDLDQYIQPWSLSRSRSGNEAFRERLRTAAVSAMARSENLSREEAHQRIDEGAWSDDPVVAAFLGAGRPAPATLHQEAALAVQGVRWNQHEVRETTRAVVERFEPGGDDR